LLLCLIPPSRAHFALAQPRHIIPNLALQAEGGAASGAEGKAASGAVDAVYMGMEEAVDASTWSTRSSARAEVANSIYERAERAEKAASAWAVESERVAALSSALAPAPEPHRMLLILGARERCTASLGRFIEDGLVKEFTVRVGEALDRVRQPELGGENKLVQLVLPILDVGGDPPRHELEFLVKLGVLHPAHTTHDPCIDWFSYALLL
jgi:hypothetical protein